MLVGLLLFSSLTLSFANIPFNNKHLEELSQWFTLSGNQVKGYWVYSDNKGDHFQVVPAVNEGDFCVDDVARVVLLYSEAYELTKDETYRKLALDASKFVLAMQDSDGEFYNFAYADGTINKQGITSYKSTSWWTFEGIFGPIKIVAVHKRCASEEWCKEGIQFDQEIPTCCWGPTCIVRHGVIRICQS